MPPLVASGRKIRSPACRWKPRVWRFTGTNGEIAEASGPERPGVPGRWTATVYCHVTPVLMFPGLSHHCFGRSRASVRRRISSTLAIFVHGSGNLGYRLRLRPGAAGLRDDPWEWPITLHRGLQMPIIEPETLAAKAIRGGRGPVCRFCFVRLCFSSRRT
jgi:hypothetical protein